MLANVILSGVGLGIVSVGIFGLWKYSKLMKIKSEIAESRVREMKEIGRRLALSEQPVIREATGLPKCPYCGRQPVLEVYEFEENLNKNSLYCANLCIRIYNRDIKEMIDTWKDHCEEFRKDRIIRENGEM